METLGFNENDAPRERWNKVAFGSVPAFLIGMLPWAAQARLEAVPVTPYISISPPGTLAGAVRGSCVEITVPILQAIRGFRVQNKIPSDEPKNEIP